MDADKLKKRLRNLRELKRRILLKRHGHKPAEPTRIRRNGFIREDS